MTKKDKYIRCGDKLSKEDKLSICIVCRKQIEEENDFK